MSEQLQQKLAGRVPLVIAVEGLPTDSQSAFIIQLGLPVKATIHLDGIAEPMNATGVKLTPKEASFPRCQADGTCWTVITQEDRNKGGLGTLEQIGKSR
jgi:hypothetical protein